MADEIGKREMERRAEGVELEGPPGAEVREQDLEPHAGLRYIARLFKVLAVLMLLMLIAEVIIALTQQGTGIGTVLVQATRLIVFASFLWASGDLALMLIESNHDLRASRILLGRVNARLQQLSDVRTSGTASGPPPHLP